MSFVCNACVFEIHEKIFQIAVIAAVKMVEPFFNPFLFVIGLSCPRSVHTSLTQNYLQLTINGFHYNLLPISCGDIGL